MNDVTLKVTQEYLISILSEFKRRVEWCIDDSEEIPMDIATMADNAINDIRKGIDPLPLLKRTVDDSVGTKPPEL